MRQIGKNRRGKTNILFRYGIMLNGAYIETCMRSNGFKDEKRKKKIARETKPNKENSKSI